MRARASASPLALACFTLGAVLAGLVAVIAVTGNPSDGDPVVAFDIAPLPEPSAPAAPPGPRLVNGNLVSDPALLEKTPDGLLPIAAGNGRKPMAAYAGAFNAADTRPRVAIVIGGLGLSASATKLALDHLPAAVTLSFAPYASNVQRWVDEARGGAHEVLLEIPMEPLGAGNPGPHTLLMAASSQQNLQHLSWALARFTGYVGATNLLGGRFLASTDALAPVMAELGKRGLLFFDNGESSRSLAASTAQNVGVPAVTGLIVLDAAQTRPAIEAKLAQLEQAARDHGAAAASGFLYPVTIETVADWAATLESRGLVLAPVSATLPRGDKTQAQP